MRPISLGSFNLINCIKQDDPQGDKRDLLFVYSRTPWLGRYTKPRGAVYDCRSGVCDILCPILVYDSSLNVAKRFLHASDGSHASRCGSILFYIMLHSRTNVLEVAPYGFYTILLTILD